MAKKDYRVREAVTIYDGQSLTELIEEFTKIIEIDSAAYIEFDYGYDYSTPKYTWYRPMTEKELEKEKAKEKKDRETKAAMKKHQEMLEREQLTELAEKYGYTMQQ